MKLELLYEEREGYIAVDLDGTLAKDDGWQGIAHIGDPIPKMVARVKRALKAGKRVKILTARATDRRAIKYIKKWCKEHIGQVLEVTNKKTPDMIELWDDRVRQVKKNTGEFVK